MQPYPDFCDGRDPSKLPGAAVAEFGRDPGIRWDETSESLIKSSNGVRARFHETDRETNGFAVVLSHPDGTQKFVFGNSGLLSRSDTSPEVAFHVWRTTEFKDGVHSDKWLPMSEFAGFLGAVASVRSNRSYDDKILIIDTRNDDGSIRVSA